MIANFLDQKPNIAKNSFIAKNSSVIGGVSLGEYSSIWYNVVVRADINEIKIGSYTNIQDACVLHVEDYLGLYIGNFVTVGHSAILHACKICDYALIGMGAIVLNGAVIEEGAQVAAGALVSPNSTISANSLAMGVPAKVVRKLSPEEQEDNKVWAKKYWKISAQHLILNQS
tara:strand:- start:1134 stop:1649 length:516 start_codon:yes stop_codon:yes gene_type:complete